MSQIVWTIKSPNLLDRKYEGWEFADAISEFFAMVASEEAATLEFTPDET